MNKGYNIRIVHETMGEIMNELFTDETQFRIFLKMVDGNISFKTDLDYYNGRDFLVHIPSRILLNSVVVTKVNEVSEFNLVKSRIETIISQ
jgi:hypothetical protein